MYDIVIFGATGTVGRRTAAWLAQHAPDVSVALAGRNDDTLKELAASLPVHYPTIVADAFDAAALATLAREAKVVIACVGPYLKYGAELVKACVEAGTDYVDLCGEAIFIRRTIDRYHEQAQQAGARIIHSCGFDSVPSDMGMFNLHAAAGEPFVEVRGIVDKLAGGISQGTVASMRELSVAARANREEGRVLHNPYTLNPDPKSEPRVPGLQKDFTIEKLPGTGWVGPFFMAMFNTRVVRRSNALRGRAYGEELFYRENWATGRGPLGRVRAYLLAGVTKALFGLATNSKWEKLAERLIPAPGTEGGFVMRHRGRTVSGRVWESVVEADGDPGYEVTAAMLAQAARTALATEGPGGVLTPATALGAPYIEALAEAGLRFSTRAV